MLNGVTKPVLEESNYSVIVGRLKHLSLFDNLPINYLHSYIYVRGLVAQDIHRIDFQGVLPRIANDRGECTIPCGTTDASGCVLFPALPTNPNTVPHPGQ